MTQVSQGATVGWPPSFKIGSRDQDGSNQATSEQEEAHNQRRYRQ